MMSVLTNSFCARNLFESEVITSLLHNFESLTGIKEEIIQLLHDFQNKLMLRVFAAPQQRTPKGIVELDFNMLLMNDISILKKLVFVGKIKSIDNPSPSHEKLQFKGDTY